MRFNFKLNIFWLFILMSTINANSQSFFESYQSTLGITNSGVRESKIDSLVNLSISQDSIYEAIDIIHDYSLKLYTYRNNADLVTLSACNTSLGEVAKGEGVLSLARGFFYSGSKSVVASLWEVNDKSTSEIMTSFYTNLKDGQTKSEAMNNAKRTYLSNHSLSEQSPYYWSSFILIGDAGAIDLSSNLYLYLTTAIAILLVMLFFRKRIL